MGRSPRTKFHSIKPVETLNPLWAIVPLIVTVGLYFLANFLFHSLPTPINNNNSSDSDERFIEKYARDNLNFLSDIGPRLVGSAANEIHTIDFLVKQLEKIQNEADAMYKIEYAVQTASGHYIIEDMVNIYRNIKNFVVRFTCNACESNSALMLNSHFDTVPESSGAGDDGTMVIVMLEVLRVLSTSENPLKHPVIFLFNGAEENSLQGSHAFITQHKWARDIKAFINLDVAGLGGKEMLFQSGPGHPWLMQHYYRSALHPYASTLAEEVFQNDFIPSDTDYRVFRDYGKIPGLDFANTYNGYVYHTARDRFNTSSTIGSLQNTGDNILNLVRSLASSEELTNPDNYAEGHTVFFDFIGLFLIFYTETVGLAVNISVIVIAITAITISIVSIYRTMLVRKMFIVKYFFTIFFIQLTALILGVAVVIALAFIIDAANSSLFWFTQQWLIFGIYVCPFAFVVSIVPALYLRYKRNLLIRYDIQFFLHSQCLLLIILSIVMTSLSIRSAFIFTYPIAFYTVAIIINWACRLQHKAFSWLIPILVSQIIPFIFFSYLSHVIYSVFIPINGRNGCANNPEILIVAVTLLITMLGCGFLGPAFSICRKSKTIICGFLLIFVAFAIMLATPLAFPFSKDAPERHWIFHMERTFHNEHGILTKNDSGYMLLPLDRYSTVTIEDILSDRKFTRTTDDCQELLVCGVPVYSTTFKPLSNYSYWVPANPPQIPNETQGLIRLVSKIALNETIRRFEFEISGPAHKQVFFNPLNDCQLIGWSLGNSFPAKDYFPESTYFIHVRDGMENTPFRFHLDFKISENYLEAIFDIVLISHHNNYPIAHTEEFKEFLGSFPEWTTLTPIVSSFNSLRF